MNNKSVTNEAIGQWFLEVKDDLFPIVLERLEAHEERLPVWLARVGRDQVEQSVLLGRGDEPDLPHERDEVLLGDGQVVIGLALILSHTAMTVWKLGLAVPVPDLGGHGRDCGMLRHSPLM